MALAHIRILRMAPNVYRPVLTVHAPRTVGRSRCSRGRMLPLYFWIQLRNNHPRGQCCIAWCDRAPIQFYYLLTTQYVCGIISQVWLGYLWWILSISERKKNAVSSSNSIQTYKLMTITWNRLNLQSMYFTDRNRQWLNLLKLSPIVCILLKHPPNAGIPISGWLAVRKSNSPAWSCIMHHTETRR